MHRFIRIAQLTVIVFIAALVSSVVTVGTAAIIVDRYIRTVLNEFHIPFKPQSLTFTSIWEMLLSLDNKMGGEVKADADANSLTSMNMEIPAAKEALPVMGRSIVKETSKVHDDIVVLPDSISQNKRRLPKEKKEKIFAMLIKKLPQEEWQRLSLLMESGLTSSEVIEVEQILAKHLNDKEYEEMRNWMITQSKKQ